MSLTSHLKQGKKSPVRKFLSSEFPNTTQLLREARIRARQAETIRPTIDVPWTTIGTALDYRLRYYFEAASSESLVAYEAALKLSEPEVSIAYDGKLSYTARPDRINFFNRVTGRLVGSYFPERNGTVADENVLFDIQNDYGPKILDDIARGKTPEFPDLSAPYENFFAEVELCLRTANPTNARLAASDEDELNRYCVVLAAIEEYVRSRTHPSAVLGVSEGTSPSQLLESVKPHWLEDLKALSWLFYDRCSHLLELPVTLNPTFAGSRDVGGADADLIVDGTILEVKSSIQARIKADFIWQLLGYVLLDYEDEHDISSIGIYMARQGLLILWPLMEAMRALSGRESPDLRDLRTRFREAINVSNERHVRAPSP